MEIFLPSLIIILVVAFFVFLVLPRTGPMVLAVVSLLTLVAAGVHHYSLFYTEYKLSTWQYGISAYTPWIVLALAILFIISTIMFMVGGGGLTNSGSTPMESIQEAVSNSAAAMPSANSATNSVTASINRSINLAPAPSGQANANRNKKTPNVPGLGYAASEV